MGLVENDSFNGEAAFDQDTHIVRVGINEGEESIHDLGSLFGTEFVDPFAAEEGESEYDCGYLSAKSLELKAKLIKDWMGKVRRREELFPFRADGKIEQTFMILTLRFLSTLANSEEIHELTRAVIRL